jgi:cell shape-determining protein MreC
MVRPKVYPLIEPVVLLFSTSKSGVLHVPSLIVTYFTSRNTLLAREESLSSQIERYENENALLKAEAKERELLLSSGSLSPSSTLIMYPVVSDLTGLYSTVVLSKGYKDGVEEKSLVYLRGRQAACTIVQVYDRTSLCKLLSASGAQTEGTIASSSLLMSLLGDGGGNYVASVPHDTAISVGDIVSLRSDQTMTLGTVVSVTKNDQATSWQVYVRGMYNPVTSHIFYTTK